MYTVKDWNMAQAILAEFITDAEAANRLHVSKRTVRRWVTTGKLYGFVYRGGWMVRRLDVDFKDAKELPTPEANT